MEEVKFKVGDRVEARFKSETIPGTVANIDGMRPWTIRMLDERGLDWAFQANGTIDGEQILFLVEPSKPQTGGLRYDSDKLRLDLLPTEWAIELARVMTVGAYKYADRNWEQGMSWSKCIGCLERHLARWKAGQMVDKETGCHELAMVAWNALALLTYQLRELGTDDRVPTGYDANFKWTEGPGTELGLSAEQVADLKAKYKDKK